MVLTHHRNKSVHIYCEILDHFLTKVLEFRRIALSLFSCFGAVELKQTTKLIRRHILFFIRVAVDSLVPWAPENGVLSRRM